MLHFHSSHSAVSKEKSMMMMDKCMAMQNGFQFATGNDHCIVFLFPGWNVDSRLKYVFTIIGVFCLGLLNGAFIYGRHLFTSRRDMNLSIRKYQMYLSLMYGIHMLLAYWMMLLVMTYEASIFIALLLGLVVGHFIFGLLQNRTPSSTTEREPLISYTSQNQSLATPCSSLDH